MPRRLSPIHPPQSQTRNGFTLVELLVVLSLIILALAAAVPAFTYITGARSTDSAENVVAAMLQRARSQAIQSHQLTGIAFFLNPRDQRYTMALISESNEDNYSNYCGWTDTSLQQNSSGTGLINGGPPYSYQQEVVALFDRDFGSIYTKDTNEEYRHSGLSFVRDNSAINTVSNSNNPAPLTSGSGSTETYPVPWGASVGFDLIPDSDFETLPANIGLQLINDPKGQSQRDRYIVTGVILFDKSGRLISIPYHFKNDVGSQSDFARLLQLTPSAANPKWPLVPATASPPTPEFYSQIGLILYDRSAFLSQPGATEQDFSLLVQGVPALGTAPASFAQESQEEQWLDQHTTPLFVNRGNGTLLKGQ